MKKKAYFRFEASSSIGAGHAIRSCVIADALSEKGWNCYLLTSQESYDFIPDLKKFERVEPEPFYANPGLHDLLVIDHYGLDIEYEKHFRSYAAKIMVIDDLANRPHECDILLDQTYGRTAQEYEALVPKNCEILTGSDYVLLRKDFIVMRPKALEKRRETKEVKRILVSMGGGDSHRNIIKALDMIKDSQFKGAVDIVLGFQSDEKASERYLGRLKNSCTIYVNPDMVELLYNADLVIGAAGSSVWERCCLGLPQILIQTAKNQESIYALPFLKSLKDYFLNEKALSSDIKIDGFGINRVLLKILSDLENDSVSFRPVVKTDKDKIYAWQQVPAIRRYFNNPEAPSAIEHEAWFLARLKQEENPYWMICLHNEPCGVLSLTYNNFRHGYELSWFVIPEKQGLGIGTRALEYAVKILHPFKTYAFVHDENKASITCLIKVGFYKLQEGLYIV